MGKGQLTEKETQMANKHKKRCGDFPGGPVVKNPPSNAGDNGSIPGQGTKIHLPRGN